MVTMRTVAPLLIVSFCAAFVYSGLQNKADEFADGFCANAKEDEVENEFSLVVKEEMPQKSKDPYAGWKSWCEPVDYETPCKSNDDCDGANPGHPAAGPMKCFNPWYAKANPEYKICAPGYARKSELRWREDRLREIVRQQYSGEAELCELDGRPIHKESWKCQRAKQVGDALTNFLLIPYDRETTRRPWKRHRLDADLRANRTAWFKQAEVYGWEVQADKSGETKTMGSAQEWANPHYGQRHRWHFGLGPFGQNAPLWVHNWDIQAPPEILCKEVEAVESYLRKARDTVVKLRHGIRCGGSYYEDKSPTWEVVHRSSSSGKICPATSGEKGAEKRAARFRKAAKAHGVDPDQVVTLKMLGQQIPRATQNARAAEIYAVLSTKWPVEKIRKKH